LSSRNITEIRIPKVVYKKMKKIKRKIFTGGLREMYAMDFYFGKAQIALKFLAQGTKLNC
jgi:hypothetical protein